MVYRWTIVLLLLSFGLLSKAQDPQFSRFYSNSLYLAPSFAGSAAKNRLSFSYRNQWAEVAPGYTTYSVSFDHNFEKLNSGVGVLMLKDVAGAGNLSTTHIGIIYSYDIKVSQTFHVRPGMQLAYTERSIDFEKLIWRDQMSPAGNAPTSGEVVSFEKVGDMDFAASIMAYNDLFWGGVSVDHLLEPNQSLYEQEFEESNLAKIPIKTQVFGGIKYTLKQRLLRPIPTQLHMAFLYKKQAEFSQLDLGFYWYYNPLVLGVWYRGVPIIKSNNMNDALVLLAGIKTKRLNIGYSYDFTVSKLITSTGGSHEISLAIMFNNPEKKRRPRKMVPCPDF